MILAAFWQIYGMPQVQLPIYPDGLTPITSEVAFQRDKGKVYYFNGHLPVFVHEERDLAPINKIAVALDGTLAEYRGGRQEIGQPRPGALAWLAQAYTAGFHVTIYNSRPANLIWSWLKLHSPVREPSLEEIIHVCAACPNADVFVDASAVPFDGTHWPTIDDLQEFTPFWQKNFRVAPGAHGSGIIVGNSANVSFLRCSAAINSFSERMSDFRRRAILATSRLICKECLSLSSVVARAHSKSPTKIDTSRWSLSTQGTYRIAGSFTNVARGAGKRTRMPLRTVGSGVGNVTNSALGTASGTCSTYV